MGKQFMAKRSSGTLSDAPNSFVELYHWCEACRSEHDIDPVNWWKGTDGDKQRTSAFNGLDKHGVVTTMTPSVAYFHQEVCEHLKQLGADGEAESFRSVDPLFERLEKPEPFDAVVGRAIDECYRRAVEANELTKGWIDADDIFPKQRPELPLAPLRTLDDVRTWLQDFLDDTNEMRTKAAVDPSHVLRLWVRYRQAELWFRAHEMTRLLPVTTPIAYRDAVKWFQTRKGSEPSLGAAQQAIAGLLESSRAAALSIPPAEPPADDKGKPVADTKDEHLIEDTGEHYLFHGWGEKCSLSKSVGVERLVAVVTSSDRRLSIFDLYQIGSKRRATGRSSVSPEDQIDRDAIGMTERRNPVDETDDSRFDDDTPDSTWEQVQGLIEERDLARKTGNEEEAQRLTKVLDVLYSTEKKLVKKARDSVRNTIDKAIERIDKMQFPNLREHFFQSVHLSDDKRDYVFAPAGLNIVWKLSKS